MNKWFDILLVYQILSKNKKYFEIEYNVLRTFNIIYIYKQM